MKDNMPFIGPKKGALLQRLVRQREPNLAVEVGSMAGYSALTIAGALPGKGRLIGMESDFVWALTARRFVWQATRGEERSQVISYSATQHICRSGRPVFLGTFPGMSLGTRKRERVWLGLLCKVFFCIEDTVLGCTNEVVY